MARPLMKKDQKGALYVRPASVEAKIDGVIGTNDWAELGRRAKITDRNARDFLPSECMVHLIRDAIRRDDQRIATLLMMPLMLRCEKFLLNKVPDSAMRNAEAVREEILDSFQTLFTSEAAQDALDFYECKFWMAFRALQVDHVRAEKTRRKELTDLPEVSNENGEMMDQADVLARLSHMARIGPAQEAHTDLPVILDAVNDLPPAQRRAVLLHRVLGYEQKEAAAMCDVDERTIRNRLRGADEGGLKKFKEDR